MIQNMIFAILFGNPFLSAYSQSDWFGKAIFWALILLSIVSWVVLIYKMRFMQQLARLSNAFSSAIAQKKDLLSISLPRQPGEHPFFQIYKTFKQHALQTMQRKSSFSLEDLELIEYQVHMEISAQHKAVEEYLFILSTAVTLAPFLGLLGTVWGILMTFSQLQTKGFALSNTAMLAGLSLALTTTVAGLLIAIPALVGYNYLKNSSREYRRDMEQFSRLLLTAAHQNHSETPRV